MTSLPVIIETKDAFLLHIRIVDVVVHACMRVCVCACVHACSCVFVRVHMRVSVCAWACVRVFVRSCFHYFESPQMKTF